MKRKIAIVWQKRERIYTFLILCCVILTLILMYYRAFFGTEITDEAYYVSEAKEMLNGNVPYAYNNSSKAVGFAFVLIPIIAIYKFFNPVLAGVFLFTRLCFVTYKAVICFCVYLILRRRAKKSHALLASALILPLSGGIQNFSYNTVPILTLFLVGCLLYDVIEQNAQHPKVKMIISGFLTGIACFANVGWTATLIIFILIISIRIKERSKKIRALMLFCGAVIAEMLIVFVPISIETSFADLWYGLYRLFIAPIPADSLNPDKTWGGVIGSFKEPFKQWLEVFIPVSGFIFFVSSIPMEEKRLSKKQRLTLSVTLGMLFQIILISCNDHESPDVVYKWAFAAFCYMIVFMIMGTYRKDKIVWYLCLYPPIYAVVAIIFLSNGANVSRFSNVYTILIPMVLVLFENKSKSIRFMATIMVAVIIVTLGYVDFHYVYRDDNFRSLTYKVQTGVYKGIYTTKARANDLPELEEYLNSIVEDDETYAFRDNVPAAYLMMHKGLACEISTWDILQHTYHRNSPAILFDYYRRRDMIPDKIIYVDYGRDEKLSITEPDYKYNVWVNTYYDLVEDVDLNETFFHILVYKYNGIFDGNYQYWIDTYWEK